MPTDWDSLPEEVQVALTDQAMTHAARIIADQAETLAEEMENGCLTDRGGAAALRLLAAVARTAAQGEITPAVGLPARGRQASLSKRVH